jgi:hypothetical protein
MAFMKLRIDEDVKRVLEFMQTSMSADRLVAIAAGVHALAPILWGRYPHGGDGLLRLSVILRSLRLVVSIHN